MSFLALWSLRALATIAIGGLVAVMLRRRSAALRSVVLRMTLVVASSLPLIGLFAPRVPVPVPAPQIPVPQVAVPMTPTPAAINASVAKSMPPAWEISTDKSPLEAEIVHRAPFSTSTFPVGLFVLPVYAFGVLALVLRWLLGWQKVRRIAQKAMPMRDEPDVLLGAIAVPATFGRVILLPTTALQWPESRRQAAILHERAHLRRHDWAWQTLASLFAAVHWFNPAAWLLARALRDTAEAAADDEVLAAGVAPSAYARELVAVAVSAGPVGPALAMARRGGVKDRVAEVLSSRRDRRAPTRLGKLSVAAFLILNGLVLGGIAIAKEPVAPPNVEILSLSTFGGQPRRSWTPTGNAMPPRDLGSPGVLRERGVVLVPLTRPGTIAMEVRAESADHPTLSLRSPWVNPVRWTTNNPGEGARWWFAWSVPKGQTSKDIRIGLASGPWKPYSEHPVHYRVGEGRVNGHPTMPPSTTVAYSVPGYFAGREVRVRAVGKDGRTLRSQVTEVEPPLNKGRYEATSVTYLGSVNRALVDHIEFETRDFVPFEFQNVALRPQQFDGGDFINPSLRPQLAWIAEGKEVWRRDGTLDKSIKAPKFSAATKPGWRRVAVGVRFPSATDVDAARATVWSKYAYPSDVFRIQPDPGDPGKRIAWCSVQLRGDVKRSKIGVDFFPTGWHTDIDTVPGDGPGRAKIELGPVRNDGVAPNRQVNISFPGVNLPGRDRFAELMIYGARGKLRTTYAQALPFGPGNSYIVYLPASETVTRLVLRSKRIDHFRFEDVALWRR